MIISRDNKLLFTVYGGSDSIAVFHIHRNGSLTLAEGSPVPSRGIQPVSLGLSRDYFGDVLWAVNQNGDPNRLNSGHPNYTAFRVLREGRLIPIPEWTVNLPPLSYPTQALVAHVGDFLFGNLLTALPYSPPIVPAFLPARGSLLQSARTLFNGGLLQAPNSPLALPPNSRLDPDNSATAYTLGMDVHPTRPILYVGFVVTNRLGVFTYDLTTGALHFVTDVPVDQGVTVCWVAVSPDGKFVYTSNAGSNSVSAFDISGTVKAGSGPLSPILIRTLLLKVPQPAPPGPIPGVFNTPTTSFQIGLDPSGHFLYVVGHELVLNNSYPEGNLVHTVRVGPGGSM